VLEICLRRFVSHALELLFIQHLFAGSALPAGDLSNHISFVMVLSASQMLDLGIQTFGCARSGESDIWIDYMELPVRGLYGVLGCISMGV